MNIQPIFCNYLATEDIDVDHASISEWIMKQDINDGKVQLSFNEELLEPLYKIVNHRFNYVHKNIGLSDDYKQTLDTAWANIGSSYTRTEFAHRHVGNSMVGVYYPKVDDDSGFLNLYNPNGEQEWIYPSSVGNNVVDNFTMFTSQSYLVKPKTGTLVIFPPWVLHSVQMCNKDSQRISIAFNCVMKLKEKL